MKHAPNIAGALLGLAFVFFGMAYFLDLIPTPPDPSPLMLRTSCFLARSYLPAISTS